MAGAIVYSRKNLSPWASSHMKELQQGMTLLAFGETTGVSLYRVGGAPFHRADNQGLYDRSRWSLVRDQFRQTFLNLYGLPGQSLIALSLSAGLASLRLPSCVHQPSTNGTSPQIPLLPAAPPLHNLEANLILSPDLSYPHLTAPIGGLETSPTEDLAKHIDLQTGNIDCPTCAEGFVDLAKEVPMSHHTNSTIVCRISGEVMDSLNEPMAFPNGYVYSSKVGFSLCKHNSRY